MGDALDFIGWYNHTSNKRLGISKSDAYNLYLAYYSGHGGYARGTWKRSSTIKGYEKGRAAGCDLQATVATLPRLVRNVQGLAGYS